MKYGFECFAFFLIGEHLLTQARPVQLTVFGQHAPSKALHHGSKPRGFRLDYLTGNDVSVDDRDALLGEQVSDRRFATAYATGQTDD